MRDCVFCDPDRLPVHTLWRAPGTDEHMRVFTPLNPVTLDHRLVVPVRHVRDATEDPALTGHVMHVAALVKARMPWKYANIITSIGEPATQSVFHLHLHVVPRSHGDGLPLPWTPQQHQEHRHA